MSEEETTQEEYTDTFSKFNFSDVQEDITTVRSIKDVMIRTIGGIDQRLRKTGKTSELDDVLKTDFRFLEFHSGELCVLSSKSGIGKSAFAFSLMKQLAVEKKQPVGFISPGNFDDESVGQRLISMCSDVNTFRVGTGMMNAADFNSVQEAANKIYESPIFYYNQPNCSYDAAKEAIKIMVQKEHVRLIIVEGFEFFRELVDAEKEKYREALENLLVEFRYLSTELAVPIMIVVELPETNSDPQDIPTLRDFKKYMFIPYIADKVIFVHRDPRQGKIIDDAKLFVAKNENGMSGVIPIKFNKPICLFFEEE